MLSINTCIGLHSVPHERQNPNSVYFDKLTKIHTLRDTFETCLVFKGHEACRFHGGILLGLLINNGGPALAPKISTSPS